MAEMMMPLTSRKTSEPVKLVKPVKCGPICVTTEITPNGGLPMIVLPGLVRAVLSRKEAESIRDGIGRMLTDESVVWAEEVDWRSVL